ncbi:hypothetical protein IFM89_019590 [Coptis chinensis]|uniref:Protein kinase domain-containing protein n=1 Tax=Coptis chinensis TaxID=261450 RepID=A0A835IDJ8_9MAGN|nr:hypothetical protein IFM89_019590 [Coptis chinensis]
MSKMKHLLRKLHIGGNTEHNQNRVVDNNNTHTRQPTTSPSPSQQPSENSSSVDFNFFEEEFQVQLALAISASDPDSNSNSNNNNDFQIKAAKQLSLVSCSPSSLLSSASSNNDDSLFEFLSLRYWNIANLVVNTMGGPVGDAEDILRRWTIRSYELRTSLNTIVLPLGCLDIGLSRHRALLFKVLADRISLPCRLVKGSYYTGTDEGAVNLIKVDHESEYIIDLMGAPGALIPAEIPSNHLQSSALDIMSSITIDERVKESKVENENILDLPEITNEMRDHNSSDSDLALVVGSSMPNETLSAVGPSKGDGSNLAEKNQTERFEHEFGKLLPTLRRSREGSSVVSAKPSPAQKMKVKDVSKYVISAAQNPEFAQKLHAVLLESGASPPPDLFAGLALPQDLVEQKVLVQSSTVDDKCKNEERSLIPFEGFQSFNQANYGIRQNHPPEEVTGIQKGDNAYSNFKGERSSSDLLHSKNLGSTGLDLHFVGDTNVSNEGVCRPLPFRTTSDGFVLVDNYVNVDTSQRVLGNALDGDVVQCSQGTVDNSKEARGNVCQQSTEGFIVKVMDSPNTDLATTSSFQNERINPMLDEVADWENFPAKKADWEILWEDIQIGERIGLGSYGEVYRADWNGTEWECPCKPVLDLTHRDVSNSCVYEVAVKKFLDQDLSGDALEQFRCEVRIMLRLRHPNVVLFMGAVTRPPNLSILTEFYPRGSLYRLLHRPNLQIDEKRRLRMALDVVKGMNYLHTSHPTIVHRDLKSPNLLVDKNWNVKVCDFGLSRLKHHTFLSSKSTAGTPEWMAPEVLRNEPSNEKSDVYSFGVILWELATLRMPWSGMNPMQVVGAVGFQNRRLEIPEDVDPVVAQTISDCWESDPNLRPSFSQLMSKLKRLQRLAAEKT